jgi:transcriptional regulator with XRE-family HTH domain
MERSRDERARAIRIARADRRLRQEDVAQLAGVHQATIAKAEDGRSSDDTYTLIEQALGINDEVTA